MITELSRRQNILPNEATDADTLERFKQTEIKIAVQKDGELTQISREIITDYFGVEVPERPAGERRMVDVSEDGQYGFVFARNRSICDLVAKGAVKLAVVGTDRLVEDEAENSVDILAEYDDPYSWPLVLATPRESDIESIEQIKRIATQYPRIATRFLGSQGLKEVEVVPTVGSTEIYPYLNYDGAPIDAVIDMRITGKSLESHDLISWEPSIAKVYPVLIQGRERNA